MWRDDYRMWSPWSALVMGRSIQVAGEKLGRPLEIEEGQQLSAIARAALRRGRRVVPWAPTALWRAAARAVNPERAQAALGRQPDLFNPTPDLFDKL